MSHSLHPENTVSLAANRSKQRHLVGLNGNEMVELLMMANDRDRHEIAARMASAVLAAKMQGLAILNFNRTSKTIANFGSVLEASMPGVNLHYAVPIGLAVALP